MGATGQPRTILELPSWVSDWNAPAAFDPLYSEFYEGVWTHFGGCVLPGAPRLPRGSSVLYCSGVRLDVIRKIPVIPSESFISEEALDNHLKEARLDRRIHRLPSVSAADVNVRTEHADLLNVDGQFIRAYSESRYYTQDLRTSISSLPDSIIYITRTGYSVLAPAQTQKGDIVAVLVAVNVPCVLRKRGDHYEMLGSCYGTYSIVDLRHLLTLPSTWDDGWSSYETNAPARELRDSIVDNKAFIIPPSAPQFCSPSCIPSHLRLLLQIPRIVLPMPILNPHTPIIRLTHLLLSLRPADPIRLAARHDTHHLLRCRQLGINS